jgi:ComF family protein
VSILTSHDKEIVKTLLRCGWGLYRQVLDIFAPPRCVVCKKVGVWLCDDCAQRIPLFYAPLCPRCGRPENSQRLCKVCQTAPLNVAPIRATFLFEGEVRDVIHALKYRGARDILSPLAKRMAEVWQYHKMESDLLIPVPLHANREAKRGYNQSILIAKALGRQIGVQVAEGVLTRVRDTMSQTKLNREERKKNVNDAFAYNADTKLDGMRVTLIDDVATTGATLEACAVVAMSNGAKSVNAFTLARAP